MKYFLLLAALTLPLEARAALPPKMEHPSLVVYKQQRRMELYSGTALVKVYRIALGLNPVPPKRKQGDYATPEGVYRTCGKVPHSSYAQALILNYPNAEDAERGLKEGIISRKQHAAILAAMRANQCPPFGTRLGGQIEIHGEGSQSDWTWGCIALDNPDIKELFAALANGTRVTIKP